MRFGKKLKLALCATLILVMLMGMNVFAQHNNPRSWFDLPGYDYYVKRGDVLVVHIWADDDFRVFMKNNTDSGCVYHGDRGNQDLTFYIGENEQGSTLEVYMYPMKHAENDRYDYIRINVSDPMTILDSSAQIAFNDRTIGTISTVNNKKNALIKAANGTDLATFAVYGVNRYEQIVVQGSKNVNGKNLLIVNTPNNKDAKLIQIPAKDKAEMIKRGIQGLYLNNRIMIWP